MIRRPHRTSTRRRRRDTAPVGPTLIKGLVTVAVLVALVALALTAISGVPFRPYGRMYVDIKSLGNLRQHDEVQIGGVRVGQVASESTTTQGARITLQIDPGISLPAGTTAMIRANGLLGARDVELIPGSGYAKLANGSTITLSRNALTYGVPELLDTFNRQTRGSLATMLNSLGEGTLGNGERLNHSLQVVAPAAEQFSQITDAVIAQPGAAARLLPSLESAVAPLSSFRDQLTALFAPGATALHPFVDHRNDTRAAIAAAPPTLDAAAYGLGHGTALVDAARALAVSAVGTLPAAPVGLRQATRLLTYAQAELPSGGTPLTRVDALLRSVPAAVPAALHITSSLTPILPRLDQMFSNATPMVNQINPYGCNIVNFGEVLRSMTGFGGYGTGPGGPAMQFRLQAVASVATLGIKDPLVHRAAYAAPCTYIGGSFPVTPGTGLGNGK